MAWVARTFITSSQLLSKASQSLAAAAVLPLWADSCHAALWARGRVAFAAAPDTNGRTPSVLVCIRRSAPSSPARLSSALLSHAAAAARRADVPTPFVPTGHFSPDRGNRPFHSTHKIKAQRSGFDFERKSDGMSEPSRLRGGEGYAVRDDALRTPLRLTVSRCGLGARTGRQLLRLRADPARPPAVPGLCPSASESVSPVRLPSALRSSLRPSARL